MMRFVWRGSIAITATYVTVLPVRYQEPLLHKRVGHQDLVHRCTEAMLTALMSANQCVHQHIHISA